MSDDKICVVCGGFFLAPPFIFNVYIYSENKKYSACICWYDCYYTNDYKYGKYISFDKLDINILINIVSKNVIRIKRKE